MPALKHLMDLPGDMQRGNCFELSPPYGIALHRSWQMNASLT
jgi:hypothetical protein